MLVLLFGTELFLSLLGLYVFTIGVFFSRFAKVEYALRPIYMALVLFVFGFFSSFLLLLNGSYPLLEPGLVSFTFDYGLTFDFLSLVFRYFIFLFSFAILVLYFYYMISTNRLEMPFEILGIFVYACLGTLMLASSSDFLMAYLALELQSLSFYILASSNRNSFLSTEAGLKYFILGGFSSGLFLFGISVIYGFFGSVDFYSLASLLSYGLDSSAVGRVVFLLALGFIVSAVLFKLSIFPFHMWTPDVYAGSPLPTVAAFSVLPKMAGFVFLFRVYGHLAVSYLPEWNFILSVLGAITLFVGSFGAVYQTSLKRLLAYSTISHVGFILLGFSTGSYDGFQSSFVYLFIYAFSSLTVFLILIALPETAKDDFVNIEFVSQLSKLFGAFPVAAISLSLVLLSFVGVPPLAGFFGKYLVLRSLVSEGMYTPAVFAVLVSVVSAFYYLRLIKVIFFTSSYDRFYYGLVSPYLGYFLAFLVFLNVFFIFFLQHLSSLVFLTCYYLI